MLGFETKASETLLNVASLDSPFDYSLHRHGKDKPLLADLTETFNYLLGLHVASRHVYQANGTRYLIYRGHVHGKHTVVLWRTTRGWGTKEFEADKEFVSKHKLTEGAEEIFVNSDSFIPGARSIDPIFKRSMFSQD
jgi:adenine-specific DNA-methyltransferase